MKQFWGSLLDLLQWKDTDGGKRCRCNNGAVHLVGRLHRQQFHDRTPQLSPYCTANINIAQVDRSDRRRPIVQRARCDRCHRNLRQHQARQSLGYQLQLTTRHLPASSPFTRQVERCKIFIVFLYVQLLTFLSMELVVGSVMHLKIYFDYFKKFVSCIIILIDNISNHMRPS